MSNPSDFVIENGVLTRYKGSGGDVVIPDVVTSISWAFYGCESLTSVTIPASVTSIGDSAFWGCKSLTSVTIPESVTEIGYEAFKNCRGLRSVIIPEGVTKIGNRAFYDCSSLTSVTIPSSVTSIGEKAFSGCGGLADEKGFVIVGNVLLDYTGDEKRVVVPKNVTSIGVKAFSGYSGLVSVVIPDTVVTIGEKAFAEETDLVIKDIGRLPAALRPNAVRGFAAAGGGRETPGFESHSKYIKNNAAKLVEGAMKQPALLALMCAEKLIAPKHVEAYVEAAQKTGKAELIALMLDYQANKISNKQKETAENRKEKEQDTVFERQLARQGKEGIAGLNIAASGELRTFENRNALKAFLQEKGAKLASSLTAKVDYLIMNDPNSDSEKARKAQQLGVEVITERRFNELAGHRFVMKGTRVVNYYGVGGALTIPEGVTEIGYGAFKDCSGLTSVTISKNVTKIDNRAFYDCSDLTSVTIPDSVTSIGGEAFAGTQLYQNIKNWDKDALYLGFCLIEVLKSQTGAYTIKQGTKCIASAAFSGCSGLTSVTIPDSVTSIGDSAFRDCGILRSVTIPDGVTSIGDLAFSGCSGLMRVVIREGVTEIGRRAFSGCSGLTSVTIPDSVTSIGDSAFRGCSGLTDEKGFVIVGNILFDYKGSEKTVVIPESVKSIGSGAFWGCSGLTSVVIPDSVTSIGDSAFRDCRILRSVTMPDGVTSIGVLAFWGCTKLTIHAPAGSYGEQYAKENKIPFAAQKA